MIRAWYFFCVLLICPHLFSAQADWNQGGGGDWNNNANWNPTTFPNAAGDVAQLFVGIVAASSIDLGQTITIGTLNIDNANNYTVQSDTLALQVSSGNATINVTNANGNGQHTISSNITISNPLTINQASTSTFTLSGVISGSQPITFSGTETLSIAGASPNTNYTGLTTVSGGTLQLSKTVGPAIAGSAFVSGGTLETTIASQFVNTAGVTIGGGTLDLGGFAQTFPTLNFQSGTLSNGSGLILVGNGTALSMRDTTINDPLAFSGTGAIVFDATNGGTATLAGALNFGGNTHTFNIANGAATPDMLVSGAIGNGGVTKTGPGTLELTGANGYTGLTTVSQGTLNLNGAATTVPGALTINGGTVFHSMPAQLAATTVVTVNGGLWDLNGQAETIPQLNFFGGNTSLGGATLELTSNGTALVMRNTSLTDGTVLLSGTGQVVFDPTGGGTATLSTLDLGGNTHSFNIGKGPTGTDMNITGVISNGGVTKIGPGTLQFSGGSANTYGGQTTVSQGVLNLAKSSGVAIAGNATINGGSISLGNPNQIDNGATLDINSGSFLMNGHTETIATLNYLGGQVLQNGGLLHLGGAPALTMQNTILSGPIAIIGGGDIEFVGASGTAFINGTVDLSGNVVTFNIANGSAPIDMEVNGIISNGGVTKTGLGTLSLQGANTYSGGTDVQEGVLEGTTTSLQKTITSSAGTTTIFDQDFNGNFNGTLTLLGSLIKDGTGIVRFNPPTIQSVGELTTIAQGPLVVNGTLQSAGALTVAPSGTLAGTGTVSKVTTVQGTLSNGNFSIGGSSLGALTIDGNTTFSTGSLFLTQISPITNDLLSVTGGNTLTIDPGATLEFIPLPDVYVEPLLYTLAQAPGGVIGVFDNVTDPFPLFAGQLIYPGDAIQLRLILLPVSSLQGLNSNAEKVANCLDALNPTPGTDLYSVVNSLRFISSVESIEKALLSMQPSAFAALPIIKEANTLYFKNALYNRMDTQNRSCRPVEKEYHFWLAPIFGISGEDNHGREPGYDVFTPGGALGLDGFLLPNLQLGGSIGYTHAYINWKRNRGDGSIDTLYGSLFSYFSYDWLSVEGAWIAGYNYYSTTRNIRIGGAIPIRRNAKAHHHGFETSLHAKGSYDVVGKYSRFSPFVSVDLLYVYEGSFSESSAKSLNLDISSKHSNLLQTEAGVELSHCYNLMGRTLTPFIGTSFIWEKRFSGDKIDSRLEGCSLDVRGYSRSRILVGTTAGFIVEWNLKSAPKASISYKGKYGLGYADNSINLELIY
ncbi:MAG: autotransporter domain-containing protein [Chlamydiia bacterium]|nr:autotransporter domain-containing protein [Chlamydiia bacterium]